MSQSLIARIMQILHPFINEVEIHLMTGLQGRLSEPLNGSNAAM